MGVSGPFLFVFCNISLSVTLFVVAIPLCVSFIVFLCHVQPLLIGFVENSKV